MERRDQDRVDWRRLVGELCPSMKINRSTLVTRCGMIDATETLYLETLRNSPSYYKSWGLFRMVRDNFAPHILFLSLPTMSRRLEVNGGEVQKLKTKKCPEHTNFHTESSATEVSLAIFWIASKNKEYVTCSGLRAYLPAIRLFLPQRHSFRRDHYCIIKLLIAIDGWTITLDLKEGGWYDITWLLKRF